jgi:CAAX prenyl protease-like protein
VLAAQPAESSATAAYLVPFLAVVAAGMLARALSENFEWMYWLRFPAALAALMAFRRDYPRPAWKPDWFAPLLGAGVFILWLAIDRAMTAPAANALPALLAASPAVRLSWVAARVAGAVIVVPIAEELAFRGYLLRRLAAVDFGRVSFQTLALFPLLGSSLAFGLMHGRLWPAGVLAGIAYAAAARRRGSLGDAIVAHATTNALLAAYVVASGQWHLW